MQSLLGMCVAVMLGGFSAAKTKHPPSRFGHGIDGRVANCRHGIRYTFHNTAILGDVELKKHHIFRSSVVCVWREGVVSNQTNKADCLHGLGLTTHDQLWD